jgi:hypothetical protein
MYQAGAPAHPPHVEIDGRADANDDGEKSLDQDALQPKLLATPSHSTSQCAGTSNIRYIQDTEADSATFALSSSLHEGM